MVDRCPACDAMILGNEQYCRQCAAPLLSDLPPISLRLRWLVRTRSLVLVNAVLSVLPLMMMVAPPTALIAWPILVGLGLILADAARRAAYPAAIKLGLAQAGLASGWVVLCLLLRNLPGAVAALGAVVVLAAFVGLFVASMWVWQNHPARDLRFQCDHCGYSLKGQVTARCPECGQPFDPARLAG